MKSKLPLATAFPLTSSNSNLPGSPPHKSPTLVHLLGQVPSGARTTGGWALGGAAERTTSGTTTMGGGRTSTSAGGAEGTQAMPIETPTKATHIACLPAQRIMTGMTQMAGAV